MKRISFFVVILFFSSSIIAQSKFGFKAGVNFSEQVNIRPFANDAVSETSLINFFQLGLHFDKQFKEKYGFSIDALYHLMGGVLTITDYCNGCDLRPRSYSSTYEYLTTSFKYTYEVFNHFRLGAGPKLALLIDENNNNDGNSEFLDPNTFDAGLEIGGIFSLNERLAFEFNYFLGLTTVREYEITDIGDFEPTKAQVQNRSFQMSILYYLKE